MHKHMVLGSISNGKAVMIQEYHLRFNKLYPAAVNCYCFWLVFTNITLCPFECEQRCSRWIRVMLWDWGGRKQREQQSSCWSQRAWERHAQASEPNTNQFARFQRILIHAMLWNVQRIYSRNLHPASSKDRIRTFVFYFFKKQRWHVSDWVQFIGSQDRKSVV